MFQLMIWVQIRKGNEVIFKDYRSLISFDEIGRNLALPLDAFDCVGWHECAVAVVEGFQEALHYQMLARLHACEHVGVGDHCDATVGVGSSLVRDVSQAPLLSLGVILQLAT